MINLAIMILNVLKIFYKKLYLLGLFYSYRYLIFIIIIKFLYPLCPFYFIIF